jgi:tRNA pseudouridine38-40 synthase
LVRVLGSHDVVGEPLRLTVAGRTDRGVHAWGQVASYRHEAVDPRRINALLDDDVSVLASEPAAPGFDARRDAVSRTYCYRVLARTTRPVAMRAEALWWPGDVDLPALEACARLLCGTHDFTAFTPTETEHVRFERDVLRACWVTRPLGHVIALGDGLRDDERIAAPTAEEPAADGRLLEFWITADTFMRHMNRALVGTMLEVASGRRTVNSFAALLEGRPRAEAGPTVAAHGLALAKVEYPAA